jgi:hypothetical protein
MSGGAEFVSSRAPEPWDDESDRDEDEDEHQPSFVLEVVAGPERGSLCLDDASDDCDADCDATPMSPTSFLSAQSSTPSKLDDNAETERQGAAFSAHYKSKPPQPHATHFAAWRPVGELGIAPQRNDFAGASPGTFRCRHCLSDSSRRVCMRRGPWGQDVVNLQRSSGKE